MLAGTKGRVLGGEVDYDRDGVLHNFVRSPNKDVTKSRRRSVSKFRKRSVGRFEDIFEFCRLFFVNRSRGENAGKSLTRSAHR